MSTETADPLERAALSLTAAVRDPTGDDHGLGRAIADTLEELRRRDDDDLVAVAARLAATLAEPSRRLRDAALTLAGSAPGPPGATGFADRIVAGALRLERLRLDLAEYAAERPPAAADELVLADLVAAAVSRLPSDLAAGPLLPSVSDAVIWGDRDALVVLLVEALRNAVQFGRGPAPRVQVDARVDSTHWELRIGDDGPGIPSESRADVLRPLVRLDRDLGRGGLGLGLATCVRIARSHGGSVRIESAGGGATVVVTGRAPADLQGQLRPERPGQRLGPRLGLDE